MCEVHMKVNVGFFNRRFALLACGVALSLLAAVAGRAWGNPSRNYLTFSQTVALAGVVLPAGAYTFEIANQETSGDVVRVTSPERRPVVHSLGHTRRVQGPRDLDRKALMTLAEAAVSSPAPIKVWSPIGESTGHEFVYR
jgi:hypothetical protein